VGWRSAARFVVDIRVGLVAWLVAAAHEVPQELGDFGVLVHSGWRRRSALAWNFASALTFLVGSLLAYGLADHIEVAYLLPFAAGNFIYISAADLLPEIRSKRARGTSSRRAGRSWSVWRSCSRSRRSPEPSGRLSRSRSRRGGTCASDRGHRGAR
jgi:zinc transporter ZupT